MNDRRTAQRRRVYLGGRIVHRFIRSETSCLLRDMTSAGARLAVSGAVPLPDRFDLVVGHFGETRPAELVRRRGDETGVRFVLQSADRTLGRRDAGEMNVVQLRSRLDAIFDPQTRDPAG